MEVKTSYSDTSRICLEENHDSDSEFCALDLLLSNIWYYQEESIQNIAASEEEINFCDFNGKHSTVYHSSASMHLDEKFVMKNNEILLKKNKTARNINDGNKINVDLASYSSPKHSRRISPKHSRRSSSEYLEYLVPINQVTETKLNYYNYSSKSSGKNFSSGTNDFLKNINTSNSAKGDISQQETQNEYRNSASPFDFSRVHSGYHGCQEKLAIVSQSTEGQENGNIIIQASSLNKNLAQLGENCNNSIGNHFSDNANASNSVMYETDDSVLPKQNKHQKKASNLNKNLVENYDSSVGNHFSDNTNASNSGLYPTDDSSQPTKNDCYKKSSNLNTNLVEPSVGSTLNNVFECCKCFKRFKRKATYNIHFQNHCDPYPYKCDVCGREYTYRCQLRNHYRVHTKEQPFKCDHCTFSTSWLCSLTGHTKRYHGK